ncbi:MAG: TIGR02647 family protein [Gammaproteobacteria bacterium]|nr:TIGR02647 family protein [Gammaproteobacteria bacterium]
MIKAYPDNLFDEIKLLAKFPEESHMEGLKIHRDADEILIKSAKALFNKGLITQLDGGYLTDSGREMSEHLHTVLDTMNKD